MKTEAFIITFHCSVEFYFSDSNLPYDKFMWTLHTKDAKEHWVPIQTVASFKRMQPFKKYDVPWMADVIKMSPELLEVDSTNTKLRRALPLVPPGNAQHERSIYAVRHFAIGDNSG